MRLAAAGYQVTALDYAAAAVAHLQTELAKAHLSAEVVAQDVLSFCTDEPFAAIYEQTCLCAIQPTLWSRYAERLYQLLTDQGRLCILFMQSHTAHGPPFHCELAQMQTLFPASRWDWRGEPTRVEHPLGLYELACVLEKRKN
jgi:cyclopropane fatty-acyl-phospholipid synthase-like methyltransferase